MTRGCSKERTALPIQSTELVDFNPVRCQHQRSPLMAIATAEPRRAVARPLTPQPPTYVFQKLAIASCPRPTAARTTARAAALSGGTRIARARTSVRCSTTRLPGVAQRGRARRYHHKHI